MPRFALPPPLHQSTKMSDTEVRAQLREIFRREGLGDSTTVLQLLSQLIPESLQEEWLDQMAEADKKGCPESFVDSLPRVPKSEISPSSSCSICYVNYLDDGYPLVVRLPHCGHDFDLECLSVWFSKSTSCPLCRDDVLSHRAEVDTSQVELEEDWGMYG